MNVIDKIEAEAGQFVGDVIKHNKRDAVEFQDGLDLLAVLGRLRELRQAFNEKMQEIYEGQS